MKPLILSILLLWSTCTHQGRKDFKRLISHPVNQITFKLRIGEEIPIMEVTYQELGIKMPERYKNGIKPPKWWYN